MGNTLAKYQLCLLAFFWAASTTAQSPPTSNIFVIESEQAAYFIEEKLEVLLDDTGGLTFGEVQGKQDSFLPASQLNIELPPRAVYWGRVVIKNGLGPGKAPSDWMLLFSGHLTEVDLYVQSPEVLIHQKTGGFVPTSEKTFLPGNDRNLAIISIPPSEQRTIFFRATSATQRPLDIKGVWIRSLEQAYFEETRNKKAIGFFIGFIFMMLAYSLTLAVVTKDRAYLFYSCYLLSLIVWQSFNTGELGEWLAPLLFPDHPQYINFFKLATYLGLFSYLAFLSSFLGLNKLLPWWNKAFKWMIWLGAALLLVDAYMLWSSNFHVMKADKYAVFYIILFVVVSYTFLWPLYKTNDEKGKFIIGGMLAMSGGFLLTAISRFSPAEFTLFYFQVGVFIELMVFSLGLAFRRKLILKEIQIQEIELEKNKIQQQANLAEAKRWKELNDLKSQFYNDITHEFRTPLTVIQGMAGQLAGNGRKKEAIIQNSEQMLQMVNQVLDLSKLEAGAMPLNWVQGDVIRLVKILTDTWQPVAVSKNVSLVFYSKLDNCTIDHDPEKLGSIVNNLVSNAIKFTPAFGSITIAAGLYGDQLEIEVSDSGEGIPPDQLHLVFNRFYQVGRSANHKTQGTGIGLALVKELVELLGGGIHVESQLGKGSSFYVRLPVHRKAPLAENDTSSVLPKTATTLFMGQAHERGFAKNGHLPKLLVVEDNADVVEYIKIILEKRYLVASAANGLEALQKTRSEQPALIICDVMMPEMDGFEFCEKIKNDPQTAHIPLILLTAKATQQNKLDGLAIGADAYLTKPFQEEELLLTLQNALLQKERVLAYLQNKNTTSTGSAGLSKEALALLEEAKQAIIKNIKDENFGVVQLARQMGFSKPTLNRRFKNTAAISPGAFIHSVRMDQARNLIETAELTVNEIAYEVGYRNPSHFSTAYKAHFGFTPSETPK